MLISKNRSNIDTYRHEISRLKESGGYYFGMAFATKLELEEYGSTDNEIFCEAYYNGCDLYTLKQKYKIKCKN